MKAKIQIEIELPEALEKESKDKIIEEVTDNILSAARRHHQAACYTAIAYEGLKWDELSTYHQEWVDILTSVEHGTAYGNTISVSVSGKKKGK